MKKVKRKGKKDVRAKVIDPEYVSHHAKALFDRDMGTIKEKTERRKIWAKKCREDLPKLRTEMQIFKETADTDIQDLKDILAATVSDRQEKMKYLKSLESQYETDLVMFKQKLVDLEEMETEGDKANKAEIQDLSQQLNAIKIFCKNKENYETDMKARERRMVLSEERHQEKLEEVRDQFQKSGEIVRRETEENVHRFKAQVEKFAKGHGPAFESNLKMRELMRMMELEIAELQYNIPNATKEIRKTKESEALLQEFLTKKLSTPAVKLTASIEETISLPQTVLSIEEPVEAPAKKEITEKPQEKDLYKEEIARRKEETLKAVLRAVRRVVVEAQSLQLIGEGAIAEESKLTDAERAEKYQQRRQIVFERREEVLAYALDVLAHGRDEEEGTEVSSFDKFRSLSFMLTRMSRASFGAARSLESDEEPESFQLKLTSSSSDSSSGSLPRSVTSLRGESNGDSGLNSREYTSRDHKYITMRQTWEFEGEDA